MLEDNSGSRVTNMAEALAAVNAARDSTYVAATNLIYVMSFTETLSRKLAEYGHQDPLVAANAAKVAELGDKALGLAQDIKELHDSLSQQQ